MTKAYRIGQIVPRSNTTIETEVPAMLRAREAIRPERRARRLAPSRHHLTAREGHDLMAQASYLNDNDTRARYATTLPPSTFMSSLDTSATRKSRNVAAAVSTAF